MSTKHIYFIYVLILLHEKCSFNICIISAIHKVKLIFQIFETVTGYVFNAISFIQDWFLDYHLFLLPSILFTFWQQIKIKSDTNIRTLK